MRIPALVTLGALVATSTVFASSPEVFFEAPPTECWITFYSLPDARGAIAVKRFDLTKDASVLDAAMTSKFDACGDGSRDCEHLGLAMRDNVASIDTQGDCDKMALAFKTS